MKKKVFAIVTTLILVLSMFASVPVIADEANAEEIGGLDFYSITLHYENPVLVSYYETKIEVVNENGKKSKVNVEYFYNTDAKSEDGKYMDGEDPLTTDKIVIPAGTKNKQNFYQVSTDANAASVINTGLWYAKIPYVNAFLTHIVNGSAICTTEKVDFYGIVAPYDDAPYEHQNPNVKYADDGYALSTTKDANGNNLKIDVNGYVIDTADNIWRTSNDERVELYTQIPVIKKTGEVTKKGVPVTAIVLSEEYEWVPFSDRFDENGKIVYDDGYDSMLPSYSSARIWLEDVLDKEDPNWVKFESVPYMAIYSFVLSPFTDEIRLVRNESHGPMFKDVVPEDEFTHITQSMQSGEEVRYALILANVYKKLGIKNRVELKNAMEMSKKSELAYWAAINK